MKAFDKVLFGRYWRMWLH